MKYFIALTLLFIPGSVRSQEKSVDAAKTALDWIGNWWENPAEAVNAGEQSPDRKQQQRHKERRKPEEAEMPKMHPWAGGYIDDAIVASKIRVRFDSGFGDHAPDRAEFFYAKCGCYKFAGFDPRAPGPGPGIVTNLNFQEYTVDVEYAPARRLSVFAEIPMRRIHPVSFVPDTGTFGNNTGLGDVRYGFKLGLDASPGRSITFQLRTYAPTGDPALGLGTNHATIEPALLYYQRISGRLAISGQFGDWHPIGGSTGAAPNLAVLPGKQFSGDVLFYGLGGSYDLIRGDNVRFTPVVEAVGWNVLGGFVTVTPPSPADGINIVNLKIGGRLTFGVRNSIYVGYGRQLTHRGWYHDILRIEYRYAY